MIHWQDLESRYAGKPEFIRKLLGVFVNSQTPTVDELRVMAADGDTENLARLAHSLKGSAGNIMARDLMGLACDLADGLNATLAEIAARLKAWPAPTEASQPPRQAWPGPAPCSAHRRGR